MPEPEIPAVVLAAGESSRLGEPKQLVRFGPSTLLVRTVELATEAGYAPVYVVLGAHAERIRPTLERLNLRIIENPVWQRGMSTSLQQGLHAATESGAPDHLLFLVCDQPALTRAHLVSLREQHLMGRVSATATEYRGRLGVPAIFARGLFPELAATEGDHGARELLARHAGEARAVPFPEAAVDIDTPADLESWMEQRQREL